MFNDHGLGQAMALSGAEQKGKDAMAKAEALEKRVAELEVQVEQLAKQVLELVSLMVL